MSINQALIEKMIIKIDVSAYEKDFNKAIKEYFKSDRFKEEVCEQLHNQFEWNELDFSPLLSSFASELNKMDVTLIAPKKKATKKKTKGK